MLNLFKKTVSLILKSFLSAKLYNSRRDTIPFKIYINFELFIRTLKFRILYFKYFNLPSKHLGAIYLLLKIKNIFNEKKKKFFLWDASLLGVARNQGAMAGSASDIDIGIIFEKKKDLKFINSLEKYFKIKFHNNYNSVQLFHELGIVDIALFKKKKNFYQQIVHNPPKKIKKNYPPVQKLIFLKKKFFPFKSKKMYSETFLVPNDYLYIVNKLYGSNWKFPDKKEQVYIK